MKNGTYPLDIPTDLLREVRATAAATGLSPADAMRQGLELGLPRLREQWSRERSLKPFTEAESREAFGPDAEWDELEAAMAQLPWGKIEEE